MKRVIFVNGKGGTGKTTAAVLIASAAAANGLTVGIEDIDPQQSLTAWVKNTEPDKVEMVQGRHKYDLMVMDTPPRLDEKNLHAVLKTADVIVVVSTLSPNDALTTERTIQLLKDLKVDGKARLLVNMFQSGTLLARQEEEITALLPIRKLKNRLSRRLAYQYAILQGWSAVSRKDAAEVVAVLLEILA